MLIKCWGARGSIPVFGEQYRKYGGNTTCLEVRSSDDELLIIDAGSGIRNLGDKLIKEGRIRIHLLFTHFHWDHIIGFPFFKPLFNEETRVDIYGCPYEDRSIADILRRAMSDPIFPIDLEDLFAKISYHNICNKKFKLGSFEISTIPLNHPNGGLGYRIVEGGKVFVFLTDNEITNEFPHGVEYDDYLEFSRGADLLIHDAEYTEEDYEIKKGWGHTRYMDALMLAFEAGVESFGLFHHNQERTDSELDEIEKDCYRIVENSLEDLILYPIYEGLEIEL